MNIVSNRALLTEAPENELDSLYVKMISGSDLSKVENQLNQWLSANPVRVRHIGQSQCERNGSLLMVVSVFYNTNSN